jgi:hypothetical protein
MFCKNIIKTLHVSVITTSPLVCFVICLFGVWLHVVYVCVCVPDIRWAHTHTHTHKHIDNIQPHTE